MTKQTIRDIDVSGRTVLVRVALNVPIKNGKVGDRLRIESAIPTLEYLLTHNAKLVLLSHHSTEGTSLAPVAPILAQLLHRPVRFLKDCLGQDAAAAIESLPQGGVALLENLRFHPEEEANDAQFAKALAALGDVFVEDDFTVTHRQHASVVGIPKYLPAVAGLQVEQEVDTITKALNKPKRPLVAIIGGAKISTKVPIFDNLLHKVDTAIIGGAMANTFLKARGLPIGHSLVEDDQVGTARDILAKADKAGVQMILPSDVVVTTKLDPPTHVRTVDTSEVDEADIIADIGPETVVACAPVLKSAGTIIWNGPVGITETPAFAHASVKLAHLVSSSQAFSLIGGGDTAAFIDAAHLHDKFGFVSTGGGASLELMAGNKLPGVECLLDK